MNARQQAGGAFVEKLAQAALHPAGVNNQINPPDRLGGMAVQPVKQAVQQLLGEIHTGGEAKDTWRVRGLKHWHPLAWFPQG